ncbi:uncharacterized protein B0I36DRAFT_366249 [Microdochium trichocladiopsis]|uniref:Uncharacterized protein n=1 Tax=Microdochium trichocladiopsis TaxID=1682393 RepID=A0A9P8Y3X2_9PEZI|nr:uncharacterized protein B0I36DRAFT_366249 [Microdochium trichocladiopsis]KAH7026722.1 hypothetical protein B0I36DRAFT_366249 [Microdochium trichocladiopsis]
MLRCAYPQVRSAKNAATVQQQVMQRILLPRQSHSRLPPVSARVTQFALPKHLSTAEDSARAVVYAAFSVLDPVGMTKSDFFAHILAQQSLHKECYRYVCLTIKDLSSSHNSALRDFGFRSLQQPEHFLNGPWGKDTHFISAVGNYSRALASFRDALPGMTPMDITYATMCFAVLEMLQGNLASRNAIMAAGVILLRPHVVAPSTPGADGATRYGIHPRYVDSRNVCNTEAICTRFATTNILGGLSVAPNLDLLDTSEPLVPVFHLPRTFSTPAGPEESYSSLRQKWNAFHGTLESWQLSRYWAIAVGGRLDAVRHLADQARLNHHMAIWRRGLQQRIEMKRRRFRSADEDELGVLSVLRAYLHCHQIATATTESIPMPDTAHLWTATTRTSGDGDEDMSLHSKDGPDEEIDVTSLAQLARLLARDVDGFQVLNFNDMFLDTVILPIISRQAIQYAQDGQITMALEKRECPYSFKTVNGDGQAATTASAGPRAGGAFADVSIDEIELQRLSLRQSSSHIERDDRYLAGKQLAMLDVQASIMRRTFEEQEEVQLGLVPQGDVKTSSFMDSSRHPAFYDGVGTSAGSTSSRSSADSIRTFSSASSTSDDEDDESLSAPHRHPASSSAFTSSQTPNTSRSTRGSTPPPLRGFLPSQFVQHKKGLGWSAPEQPDRFAPQSGDFSFMPLRMRKEFTLACVDMQLATASAALRDGVHYAQVVS